MRLVLPDWINEIAYPVSDHQLSEQAKDYPLKAEFHIRPGKGNARLFHLRFKAFKAFDWAGDEDGKQTAIEEKILDSAWLDQAPFDIGKIADMLENDIGYSQGQDDFGDIETGQIRDERKKGIDNASQEAQILESDQDGQDTSNAKEMEQPLLLTPRYQTAQQIGKNGQPEYNNHAPFIGQIYESEAC